MKFEQLFLASLFSTLLAEDYIFDVTGDGLKVSTDEYPFIARLSTYGPCTGSLVANDLILTAKHCFFDSNGKKEKLTGTAKFNDPRKLKQDRGEIKRKIRFVKDYPGSDLALAKLDKKVTGINPVKISKKRVEPGDSVKAVGFGMHGFQKRDYHLRHIDLKVSEVRQDWIYTSVGKNNEGPCAGDSGGPLLVKNGGEWAVVAALKGAGYDCRTNITVGDDRWSSVRVMGSDDLNKYG